MFQNEPQATSHSFPKLHASVDGSHGNNRRIRQLVTRRVREMRCSPTEMSALARGRSEPRATSAQHCGHPGPGPIGVDRVLPPRVAMARSVGTSPVGGSSCSQESALDGSFSREGPATGMPERHAQQSSSETRA
jgi:hypothetical protein